MLRYLPPAGHKILWSELFRALWGGFSKTNESHFKLFDDNESNTILYVNSGTSALCLLLKYITRLSGKREVIIPGYTCPSIAAAVIQAGLKPVLCDLEMSDFSFDLADLKKKINTDTLAIIKVELFGLVSANEILKQITKENDIILIGDIAQSLGNYLSDSNLLYARGYDYIFFSLGRGKPINLLHGGGIIFPQKNLPIRNLTGAYIGELSIIDNFKVFLNIILYIIFFNPWLYSFPRAIPFLKLGETIFSLQFKIKQMNRFILRILRVLYRRFPEIQQRRKHEMIRLAEQVKKYSADFIPINIDQNIDLVRFPIIFKDPAKRDRVWNQLNKVGIGATGLYPFPLNLQPGLENYKLNECPKARQISEQILTLPIHEHVKEKDLIKIEQVFKANLLSGQ